jgi:ribosomal protein S12 methylthiotransferase
MMREAEKLAAAGVKELLVISQDTSAYGVDVKYASSMWKDRNGNEREIRAKFLDLSQALGELGVWVRMHYVYPYPHVADVIPLMAEERSSLSRHPVPACLARGPEKYAPSRAWRKDAGAHPLLARCLPDLAIRSTFIVGFPGETDADFEMLLDWLDEAKIDRAGCFKYEPVKGRVQSALLPAVPQEIKEALASLHAASAKNFRAEASEEGWQTLAGHHR